MAAGKEIRLSQGGNIIKSTHILESQSISASFSEGIRPSSEAATARLTVPGTLGPSKSLQRLAFQVYGAHADTF